MRMVCLMPFRNKKPKHVCTMKCGETGNQIDAYIPTQINKTLCIEKVKKKKSKNISSSLISLCRIHLAHVTFRPPPLLRLTIPKPSFNHIWDLFIHSFFFSWISGFDEWKFQSLKRKEEKKKNFVKLYWFFCLMYSHMFNTYWALNSKSVFFLLFVFINLYFSINYSSSD